MRGDRVTLRPVAREDVPALRAMRMEPSVHRWWGPPENDEWPLDDPETTVLVIEAEGALAGLIQFWEEPEPAYRHAGVDVFLGTAFQGRGLGLDAVRTVCRHLVGERGHHRLTIDPAATNAAAIRCYERAGFRPVGVMREHWRAPDGTLVDGLLMDLLAAELR